MAQIRADEISRVLLAEIENFDAVANVAETGSVISVGDGIARIYGLENVMAGELIEFGPQTVGLALNLEEDQVGAVLLGDYGNVKEGDQVKRGQIIGLSGGTGRATGPHLHVAVRWQGTYLDPASLMRLRLP